MFGCLHILWMWLSHLSFCWSHLFGSLLKPILTIQRSCSTKQFQLLCCNFEKAFFFCFFFSIEVLSELYLAKSRQCGWGWPLNGQSVYHYIGCDAVVSHCLPWGISTTGNGRKRKNPLRIKWRTFLQPSCSISGCIGGCCRTHQITG